MSLWEYTATQDILNFPFNSRTVLLQTFRESKGQNMWTLHLKSTSKYPTWMKSQHFLQLDSDYLRPSPFDNSQESTLPKFFELNCMAWHILVDIGVLCKLVTFSLSTITKKPTKTTRLRYVRIIRPATKAKLHTYLRQQCTFIERSSSIASPKYNSAGHLTKQQQVKSRQE